jgi:hypothetical protein
MSDHVARFPGISNDPAAHVLTNKQAARLAALAPVAAEKLAGQRLVDVTDRIKAVIDPSLLAFRKVCGRVVKLDAAGNELPVPFATVTVYDVDLGLLAWSPADSLFSWFYPFNVRREQLARVTTDECGRFCVWLPRFDIDYYLKWRLERQCYLGWLRRPSLEDLLRAREVLPKPQPDPGPIKLDEHLLVHASRVIDAKAVVKLREVSLLKRPGPVMTKVDPELARAAFPQRTRAPLTADAVEALSPKLRPKLAARIGVPVEMLAKLDPKRVYGPFLRCREIIVPQWSPVLDVPDISFEVTQDVNGDGQQEVIYSEGLFEVRWDANAIADVVLRADSMAVTSTSCDVPDVNTGGDVAILFASNYPLQVGNIASDYHDGVSGYAKLPNRPDADGVPGGTRTEPSVAPFVGSFYLMGNAERPGATHYRVHHQVDGGAASYLNGAFGPLMKLVGTTLQQLVVTPVDGQWYPIVPRSAGWTPVGILAPVSEGGDHLHSFHLEFGVAAPGGAITPVANSATPGVNLQIDGTGPTVEFQAFQWRHPEVSLAWQTLATGDCAVVAREANRRVQFRLALRVSADHLRNFAVGASGCGPAGGPTLITDGRDGLPVAAADAAAHWYRDANDNAHSRELFFELPAGAPAGCYNFSVFAATRAFAPTAVVIGADPTVAWRIDSSPVYTQPVLAVAVQ